MKEIITLIQLNNKFMMKFILEQKEQLKMLMLSRKQITSLFLSKFSMNMLNNLITDKLRLLRKADLF